MLDSSYKPNYPYKKGDYNLRCPIDSDWKDKKQRVLLVIETIDSEDLTKRTLLHNRSRIVVENLLRFSIQRAKQQGFKRSNCAFAAVNFNNRKFMDQPRETWPTYKNQFTKRLRSVIEELEPTHVIIFGDHAAESFLQRYEIDYVNKKRGWVHDLKVKGVRVKVTNTLDLNQLYTAKKNEIEDEDDDDLDEGDDFDKDVYGKSNLLFYVSDHVTNILVGRLIYDLSDVKPRPVYVDTIPKFKKFYEKLTKAEYAGLDTETKNGSVNHNAIHTIQFAFSTDKGYVIPFQHPDSPFNEKEKAYIHKKLREFLSAPQGKFPLKYLITQYGMYDLRVCRKVFGIPVIHHPVWEITAGEFCLDENRKYLAESPFNTPHGGLEQIFMVYGNDHYKKAPFGKGDRSNPNLTRLDNKDFIEYGAMDVQSIVGIHLMQQKRAADLKVGDKNFLPYFKRLVVLQMSNTVHSISHMRQKGAHIDKLYLTILKSNNSPMLKLLKEAQTKIFETKEAKAANKLLLKENNGQVTNRGLFNKVPWVFELGKPDHKKILFFSVMGLKPVSFTKTNQPQVNKTFIKAYKDNPIVEAFGTYQKLYKLWSAYVKGWWNKIQESEDSKKDWRLRADYGFFEVVTGRLNSKNPSLQQVPSRGSEAKYIKRAFVAPKGCIQIKFDYSAHEIRVWSYVSGDEELASVFRVGQKLRQELRRAKTPELVQKIFTKLKKRGDIHIQNVKFFFDKWVDKDHELRDAIKQVIFGVLYGKGAGTLARDIKKDKAFAQDLIDKLFARFKKGAKWLDWTKKHARDNYYTYSPIGMRRNLFGIMTGIGAIASAMERRAANSPIQGFASQIGITTSRLVNLELYKVLMEFGFIDENTEDLPADILKAVHDALYSEVPYEIVLIYIHVLQWVATYGVTKYYKENFGVEFTIEPEIEIELSASEDKAYKWDWTDASLKQILQTVLDDQVAIGFLEKNKKEEAFQKIMSAYDNKKLRDYLTTNYPILGVKP